MRFPINLLLAASANAFISSPVLPGHSRQYSCSANSYRPIILSVSSDIAAEPDVSAEQPSPVADLPPILEELRDVAMKLHTREQAPKEGQAEAPAKPDVPYVPTRVDYFQFLVDSHAVYVALEEIVNGNEQLAIFRNCGLERSVELENDILWMTNKYALERPDVGAAGKRYAEELRAMVKGDEDIPAFVCHFYNFYFAHLAGGRMIGKQMSKLLLDGETLEFYRWGENVNELKSKVKNQIEDLAREWSKIERDSCINATAGAFRGGGALNGYLYGASPH